MSNESNQNNIFINGRQQIIEMLQYMEEGEKQKLLNNIKLRNASMAKELSEQSFSFKNLFSLSRKSLERIFSKVNPAIIGLALYPLDPKLQRKALMSLDRGLAEEAFHIMKQNLSHKKQETQRAQEKIVQIAIQLSKQNHVSL